MTHWSRSQSHRAAIWAFIALAVAMQGLACVDNEISFFIEHVKVQPEAPECISAVGDAFTSGALVDLSAGYYVGGNVLVRNQLVSREDYGNLIAESNNVFVEGVEVFVTTGGGDVIGESTFDPADRVTIEPESEGIVPVAFVPSSVGRAIADQVGCLSVYTGGNYPVANVYEGGGFVDANGQPFLTLHGSFQANVRVVGHTGAGTEVETQEFAFYVEWCCGCLVEWHNCWDPCERYCTDPEESGWCIPGVANGGANMDCRNIYHRPSAVWQCGTLPDGDSDTSNDQPILCDCATCEA